MSTITSLVQSSLRSPADLAGHSFEQIARSPNVSEKDKLGEVAREFEAYLLRLYVGEARKTLVASTFNPDGGSTSIYHDMITGQLADSISRAKSLGLATGLAQQLTHQN